MQHKLNNPVLVLPSWYPNKIDNFAGDFIQRHVKAIALYVPQYIIHFVKDEHGIITKDVHSEICNYENYTEEIIYYYPAKTGAKYLDRFISYLKFTKLYKKNINRYFKDNENTTLVHVHVALMAGIIATWIKQKFKVPFILSEHWTIYLPQSNYQIKNLNLIYQKHLREILKKALIVTVVSNYLGNAIQQVYPFIQYKKIPNVVDTSLFYPLTIEQKSGTKFIHASLMNYQKNVEGICYAAKIAKDKGYQFSLDLFGPIQNSIKELIATLKLNNIIFLRGEVPQSFLASELQLADALILYSRFETFGCIIIEAQACGLPVITSDLQIFEEIISPGINGLFAKENTPSDLAEVMMNYCENKNSFTKSIIAQTAEKYSYAIVGKEFESLYKLQKK